MKKKIRKGSSKERKEEVLGKDQRRGKKEEKKGKRIKSLPRILLRSALCMSGFSAASRLRSDLAHTIKAFIGRRIRGSLRLDDVTRPRELEHVISAELLDNIVRGAGGGNLTFIQSPIELAPPA